MWSEPGKLVKGGSVPPPSPSKDDDQPIPQFDGNITLNSTDFDYSESESSYNHSFVSNNNYPSSHSDYNGLPQSGCTIPTIINAHNGRGACTAPPPWYEPYTVYTNRDEYRPARKTIYRDNRLAQCLNLPTISVANLRSLWLKVNNVRNDILEREIGVALWSEVWEKKGKKKHAFQVEKCCKKMA